MSEGPGFKYQTIADHLRQELQAQEDPFLPSQRELSLRFNANRRTVQQAMSVLEQEGLVLRAGSRGYVTTKKPVRLPSRPRKIGYPVWVSSLADIDLGSSYSQSQYILAGLRSEVQRFGFELDIQLVGPQANPDYAKIDRLCKEWSAVVLEPLQHSLLHRTSLRDDHPFAALRKFMVVIGNVQGGKFNCVYPDIYGGTKLAVEHLLERDASHIFYTGAQQESLPNLLQRVAATEQSVSRRRDVRITFGNGSSTATGGYSAVKTALSDGVDFDAVIADSCYSAIGAMGALREARIAIGREVQLVSLGNLPILRFYSPVPTAIQFSIEAVAQDAARMAIELINNGGCPIASRILTAQLHHNETTRQLPAPGEPWRPAPEEAPRPVFEKEVL